MSEDCDWNPDWWREAKAASLERRRRVVEAAALAKPGDAFLIVTEGTVTEPIYFDLLLRDLQLSVVRIKVQPGDASDPRHVIRTAEREAKDQARKARKGVLGINEPAKFDHVWAVVDTDDRAWPASAAPRAGTALGVRQRRAWPPHAQGQGERDVH